MKISMNSEARNAAERIAQNILENPGDGNAAEFVTLGDLRVLARAYLAKGGEELARHALWTDGYYARRIERGDREQSERATNHPEPEKWTAKLIAACRESAEQTSVDDADYGKMYTGEGVTLLQAAKELERLSGERQRTIEECAKIIDVEVAFYTRQTSDGQGEHGKPGYIKDETMAAWNGKLGMACHLARAIRSLSSPADKQ